LAEDPIGQKSEVSAAKSLKVEAPLIQRKNLIAARHTKFQNSSAAPDDDTASSSNSVAPAKRGRPPGQPKSGGRQPLTGASPDQLRMLIGDTPIRVLLDIALGRAMSCGGGPNGTKVKRYPTLSERQSAANRLLSRVLPELQRAETTLDASVSTTAVNVGVDISDHDTGMELAKRVAFMLTAARRSLPSAGAEEAEVERPERLKPPKAAARQQQPVTIDQPAPLPEPEPAPQPEPARERPAHNLVVTERRDRYDVSYHLEDRRSHNELGRFNTRSEAENALWRTLRDRGLLPEQQQPAPRAPAPAPAPAREGRRPWVGTPRRLEPAPLPPPPPKRARPPQSSPRVILAVPQVFEREANAAA
jgi:hypothetical protein